MKELEYKLQSQKWDYVFRLGQSLIKCGTVCFICWRLGLAIEALAGRQTLANFGILLIC
jgi:hypothetical protein